MPRTGTLTAESKHLIVEPARMGAATSCRVVPLSPERQGEWNEYALAHAEGTLFHTTAWRDAVKETFGHADVYPAAVRSGRIVGILPMFLVASRLTGRRLVSVPYGVGGGIIGEDSQAVAALFEFAKHAAQEQTCGIIDLRSERAVVPSLPVVDRYAVFRRELPDEPGDVLSWLPRKARAAARNARNKYRLTASFGDEHLETVWRLYSLSMRRLASLTYPLRFFERLITRLPDRHWVSVVRWNGRPVAGLLTLLFGERAMPYFIGASADARRCSAANFIYLTVMERSVEHGYRIFDFGRSRRDNTGSYDFKRFNGFVPKPLQYQHYTQPGHAPSDLSPDNPRFRLVRRVWPHIPLWVSQTIGARLARHCPG